MTAKIKKLLVIVTLVATSLSFGVPAYALTATPGCDNANPTPNSLKSCVKNNPLVDDLNSAVNILAALVGVVVTAVIVFGGVQYATSGGNPEASKAAKTRITNGLLALIVFMFTYALLQWLIPGGIFSK
jgi:hypothetical protein